MVSAPATGGVRPFLQLVEVQALRGAADRDLLRRFAAARDEAAFRVIAERHGPMVFGVCARLLGNRHDAEDALQATFLVFARRAGLVRNSESLASWLHGVARRVAGRLRRADARRAARERAAAAPDGRAPADELAWGEVRAGLDEELARLPAAYREVLVLCYLEGLTRDEAGQRLGLDAGAVKGRLERGRRLLGERLTRRGIGLSAALAGAAAAPPALAGVRLARLAADPAAASPRAAALTHEFLKGVAMSKLKVITAGLVGAAVLAAGVGVTAAQSRPVGAPPPASQPLPAAKATPAPDTDEAFIRRVSKDLRGSDPTPAEVHFFLASKDANKRATLVDLFVKERADAVAGGRGAAPAAERAAVEALTRAREAEYARAVEAARAEADLARAVAEKARAAAEKDAAGAVERLRDALRLLNEKNAEQPAVAPRAVPPVPAPPPANPMAKGTRAPTDPTTIAPPVPPLPPAAPKAVAPPAVAVPVAPAATAEVLRVRAELAEVNLREKQLAVRELEEHVKTGTATRTALDRAKLEVERAQLQLREALLNLEAARPAAPALPPPARR